MPKNSTAQAPYSVPSDAFLAGLVRRGEMHETRCGDGTVVWHRWGKGAPLLLLHGAHGSWMHWARNIAHFSSRWTIWVPDLPGFGWSAMPSNGITSRDIADALVSGLGELGLDQALDVLGFSLGGTIGVNLALAEPGLVRRVVLIDCGGLGTGLGALEMVSIRRAHDVVGAHRHNLLQMMIHDPDKLDGLALHIQQLHVPLARIDPTPLVLPNMLARALAQTDVAVDAIWGEYDRPHPDPVAQWTALRRYRPDASLRVVPGAGHWSIYENPEAFHRCCDELLAPDSADRSGADETSADP